MHTILNQNSFIPFLTAVFRSFKSLSRDFFGDLLDDASELEEYDESESEPLESEDPEPDELRLRRVRPLPRSPRLIIEQGSSNTGDILCNFLSSLNTNGIIRYWLSTQIFESVCGGTTAMLRIIRMRR